MKKIVLIGGGIVIAILLGMYLYTKQLDNVENSDTIKKTQTLPQTTAKENNTPSSVPVNTQEQPGQGEGGIKTGVSEGTR